MIGMQRDDVLEFKLVADPDLNQQGDVAFAVVSIDEKSDRYISHLYLGGETSEVRQITFADCQAHSPCWSPDGKQLAYLSNRDDQKSQLWILDLQGSEPRKVTAFAGGISSLAWSPDGQQLAVIAKTKSIADCPDIEELLPGEHPAKGPVRIFRRLQYKHATGMRDGTYAQIYVVPAHARLLPLSEAQCLSSTLEELDCANPCWSPDGRQVAFVASPDVEGQTHGQQEIFVTTLCTGQMRQLTAFAGSISALAWSPQGDNLAFAGHDLEKRSATYTRIWLVSASGESNIPQCLTRHIDLNVGVSILSDIRSPFQSAVPGGSLQWSSDAENLYFLVSEGGIAYLAALHLADGQLTREVGGDREVVVAFARNQSGQIVYSAENALNPAELFFRSAQGEIRPLTAFNAPLLSQRKLARPRQLDIEPDSDGNGPLGAWLLPPVDYDPERSYPLLLQVHGGPHNSYGWSFFHEFHLLSAQGYFVLYTNPRGSQSYGQEACAAVVGDWGGCDYRDLMRAVDVAIQEPQVDEAKLGILGGSYGGYMTNWVVTQTDRFAAACTQRSVTNRMSMYGTSDIGYSFIEFESPGKPWDGWQELLERSAIWYADRVVTPLLIIHSTNDVRCPIEQAHQLFVALKRLGKESEFVMYEGEDHGLSREGTPSRRLDRLQRILNWFASHLTP